MSLAPEIQLEKSSDSQYGEISCINEHLAYITNLRVALINTYRINTGTNTLRMMEINRIVITLSYRT